MLLVGRGGGGQVFMDGSEAVMRIRKIKVGSVWNESGSRTYTHTVNVQKHAVAKN